MTSQIATLSEGFKTLRASKRTLACVLAEMVSQIAAFFENWATMWMTAFEIQLNSHGVVVSNFNGLVPWSGYSFKSFWLLSGCSFLFYSFVTFSKLVHKTFGFFFGTRNNEIIVLTDLTFLLLIERLILTLAEISCLLIERLNLEFLTIRKKLRLWMECLNLNCRIAWWRSTKVQLLLLMLLLIIVMMPRVCSKHGWRLLHLTVNRWYELIQIRSPLMKVVDLLRVF